MATVISCAKPGGLIVGTDGYPEAVATLALPVVERAQLVALFQRFGRRHPSGTLTIPEDCVKATVRYTSRTPVRRQLREAVVVAVQPGGAR